MTNPLTGRPYAAPEQYPPMSYPPPPYPYPAPTVTRSKRHTSHTFHLIMTILTFGVWGFVWLFMIIWNQMIKEKSITR